MVTIVTNAIIMYSRYMKDCRGSTSIESGVF